MIRKLKLDDAALDGATGLECFDASFELTQDLQSF